MNYLFVRNETFESFSRHLKKNGNKTYFLTYFLTDLFFLNGFTKIIRYKKGKIKKKEIISRDEMAKLQIRDIEKISIDKNIKKMIYIYENIYNLIKEKKIDVILVHNGYNWLDQLTIKAGMELEVKIFYFEEGLFRPNSITIDKKGINYESSISEMWKEYLKEEILEVPQEEKFKKNLRKNKKKKFFKILRVIEDSFNYRKLKLYNHKKLKVYFKEIFIRKKNRDDFFLNRDYIFVPFQVHDDTQIQFQSPNIKSMEELVKNVVREVEKVNKKREKKLTIIFKEHPKDRGRVDYQKLYLKYKKKDIYFMEQSSTKELIKHSKLVITINSTVGIEALEMGKKVITLGNAFYNEKEIVCSNRKLSDLNRDIEHVLEMKLNLELIKKYIFFLKYKYNIRGNLANLKEQECKEIESKIKNL